MVAFQNSANISKHLKKALTKHKAGDFDKARFFYEKILKEDPDHIDGNYLLGTLNAERGNYPVALKLLKRAAELAPRSPAILNNLGNLYRINGDFDLAIQSYKKALANDPNLVEAYVNMGLAAKRLAKHSEAATYYRQALKLHPGQMVAQYHLGQCLEALGKPDEAKESYRRVLEIIPNHSSAQYHLDALTGNNPETAPKEFVLELFDTHADKFESYLVGNLGYNGPDLIQKAVLEVSGKSVTFENVLDLGCGTGLSGKVFRDISKRITGCDLAPRMIEESRKKNIYDELIVGDAIECLNRETAPYDLIVAADLLVYLGALDKLFEAISAHVTDNALLTFSVEPLGGDQDYQLLNSGRYAQSRAYVQRLAEQHQFKVEYVQPYPLRKEGDIWIDADIYVLKRTA
ncbi:MAG: tetratricopeptide repeat protein [Gallionella sp.]